MKNIKKIQRQIDKYKYGGVWKTFKSEIVDNPYIGIAVAVFFVLIGAFIAAVINYISTDSEALIRFICSFLLCLTLLIIGFFYFLPYWFFRRNYSFIEDKEKNIAIKLLEIYNRSQQTLTSFDGINAIELYTVESHTDDNHILYKFKNVFTIKSKYFDLSKLKKKEIEVPIELFNWLKEPNHPVPDYGLEVNALIYKWLESRATDDKYFNNLIDNWEVEFYGIPKIYSIHYHIIIEAKQSLNDNELNNGEVIDSVFMMEYNGGKEHHKNRQYYSLRININDPCEGTLECVLLIIANKRRINQNKIAQIMSNILNPRGEG